MPYTAGDLLIRAIMTTSTGLPADQVVNDFAFRKVGGSAPTDAQVEDAMDAVDQFYRSDFGTAASVSQFIGPTVNRAATHEQAAYTIVAGPLGSPRLTRPWIGPAAPLAGTSLPTEVAAVLSFHGDLTGVLEESGATRPRARRRGRVYIPCLTTAGISGAGPALLSSALLDALRTAAVGMYDFADAEGWRWSVWSREASELYPVVGGWTDNAPDTQRRRGSASTARVTYNTV